MRRSIGRWLFAVCLVTLLAGVGGWRTLGDTLSEARKQENRKHQQILKRLNAEYEIQKTQMLENVKEQERAVERLNREHSVALEQAETSEEQERVDAEYEPKLRRANDKLQVEKVAGVTMLGSIEDLIKAENTRHARAMNARTQQVATARKPR